MSAVVTSRGSRIALAGLALVALALGISAWQHSTAQERAPARDTAALEHARGLSRAFRNAAEVMVPTVVTIETTTKSQPVRGQRRDEGLDGENPFKGTPFEEFFRGFEGDGQNRRMPSPKREGMGSGVIIDKTGVILTNNHVVDGADEVLVRLSDGREFKATVVGVDDQTDLAVIRIKDAGTLPAAKLGDSDALEIGDWVIAVGNPFGLDSTVSAGIISGKGRELRSGQRTKYLQTDAAINPGNSGGPLVNLDGEVVGINTAIATNSGGYQGVGFAVPVNQAKWVTTQLIERGSVQRAYLGVGIEEVTNELAEKFGVARGSGVLVAEVFPDTPAAAAGFHEGDLIIEFAGKKVTLPRDLQELVERAPFDSKQAVKVLRDGKALDLTVVVKALPKDLSKMARRPTNDEPSASGFTSEELGVQISDLTPAEAEKLSLKGYSGVLINSVTPDSVAAEVGLREGMLIMRVGKEKVESVQQFKDALAKESLDKGVLLQVRTDNGNRFVVVRKG